TGRRCRCSRRGPWRARANPRRSVVPGRRGCRVAARNRMARMPFELPDNLHPNCAPIAWMLGTWRANGHGDFPTIEKFEFGQELIFTHDGRPFLHYMARSWVVDDKGEKVRAGAIETGFIRCPEPGKV